MAYQKDHVWINYDVNMQKYIAIKTEWTTATCYNIDDSHIRTVWFHFCKVQEKAKPNAGDRGQKNVYHGGR